MNEIYKNYFARGTAAARYAAGRPHFHAFVIEKIARFLGLEKAVAVALDVGCGTGLSSVALRGIAEKVVGLDVSLEMLRLAAPGDAVEYVLGSAEMMPFGAGRFGLITISQAIHWLDQDKFFAEARRVLSADSWLIAYDNHFLGRMPENPEFHSWYREKFLKEYPTPPRAARSFAAEREKPRDFVLEHEEWHENSIQFSARETVDFLLTISNVIAAVENGGRAIERVSASIAEDVESFFISGEKRRFAFTAPVWYLRRDR